MLADRPDSVTRFLITSSASPAIVKGVSESLAGRVRLLALNGFNAEEIGWENWQKLWLQGGFPRAYDTPPFRHMEVERDERVGR